MTPWECGFSLHSRTTDTAHVPWFSHCFATIDNFCNFCLVFLQWLNKTKNQKPKTKKTKKTRNQKNQTEKNKNKKVTRPNSLPLLPPLGCAVLFFGVVSWFFGFLFSSSLLFFLQWLTRPKNQKKQKNKATRNKKKTRNKMTRPNSLPLLPPLGCAILFFLFFFFFVSGFFCFLFSGLCRCYFEGQLFASSPTLGVANLLLVDFIICFGPVVTPSEFPIQNGWP